jgi:MFS family permease
MTDSPADPSRREFIGLCLVMFLAVCNLTAFYDLFDYLATLGVRAELRGVIVGAYSFTAMALYAAASPFVTARNAPRVILAGLAAVGATSLGYLFVHGTPYLLALRVAAGAGQFCVGAGVATLLVTVIPPGQSGRAFGLYSTSILVAYALMPAFMDALAPVVTSPPRRWAGAAAVSLVPAAAIVWRVRGRFRARTLAGAGSTRLAVADLRRNLARPSIVLLVLLNLGYFANWSGVFFLFKGFARLEGMRNVGAFFVVQTGLMIAVRLGAGRLFDVFDKAWLAAVSFASIALGNLALGHLPGPWAVPWIAVIFGLGLGAGYPAINGLMFEVSEPRFRPLNANLMLFAVQAGSFVGPTFGGAAVARFGYGGYFAASAALAVGAVAISLTLSGRRAARAP